MRHRSSCPTRPTSTRSATRWRSSASPARTTRTGVWRGGANLLPEIGAELTPELQYVALDADDRLVRTSDSAAYLKQAVDSDGEQVEGVDEVVDASGEPLSAAIYTGTHACQALAMTAGGPR